MLKLLQILQHKTLQINMATNAIGWFQNLINEYLNYIFKIGDTSICK